MTDTLHPTPTIPLTEAITALHHTGISADTIALSFNLPVSQVRSIIRQRAHTAPPEEEQLQEEVRRLTQRAVRKAMVLLDHGPMQVQQRIITASLSGLSKLLRNDDAGSTEEARQAFQELAHAIRDVQRKTELVTDDSIIEVPESDVTIPSPPPQATDHQD